MFALSADPILLIKGSEMKKIMDDNRKLVEKAVGILMDKLGPVEASRFLAMHQAGKLDSVKRHHLWQSKLDKDDFFKEIFG